MFPLTLGAENLRLQHHSYGSTWLLRLRYFFYFYNIGKMRKVHSSEDTMPIAVATPVNAPSAPPLLALPVQTGVPIVAQQSNRASNDHYELPTVVINDLAARDYLSRFGWPEGLQEAFITNLSKTPIRYFIVDDSGSMATSDGHRLAGNGTIIRSVSCSRWAELGEGIRFHAGLAAAAKAPTEFRFLNSGQPVMIGADASDDTQRLQYLHSVLDQPPGGGTPLCKHVADVAREVRELEAQLRATRQRAVIVIATDGEASDGNLAQAMRVLQHLPVWVVVRLCTDDSRVAQYWNNIDTDLELELEVLDDLASEAAECGRVNGWLTYCEPLHRLREFGVLIKELDLLDERALNVDEMRTLMAVM